MSAVVAAAVQRVVDAWRSEGSQPQARIPWPRRRWREWFPHDGDTLVALPDALSRATVRGAWRDAAETPTVGRQRMVHHPSGDGPTCVVTKPPHLSIHLI